MKYAYYPGCALEGMNIEYNVSLRNLFDRLEIEVEEIPGWICCGTLAAPSTSRLLGLSVPLWNVAKALEARHDQIIAPCSACLYHFKSALHELEEEPSLVSEIEEILGVPLDGKPKIMHPIELLSGEEFETIIKEAVVNDLSGLKVVCYYGCLITRPPKVMQFDVAEYPQSMDRILRWAGIQTLDWACKTECCGANFNLLEPEIVIDLSNRIFAEAKAVGAEAIVVACPMCHGNLDTRESEIEAKFNVQYDLPIFYFSQLMGLAVGIPEAGLGFWKHVVDPGKVLSAKWEVEDSTPVTLKELSRER
ncbi:MAG: CoB--CoM heterodisulfide reductase iron-sulfur subunit B family protein [Anaerolineae bacterium]